MTAARDHARANEVLDQIDAATGHRCACGCGLDLIPDGPSAWFATQDCQRVWQARRATNPEEVLSRPDAGTEADELRTVLEGLARLAALARRVIPPAASRPRPDRTSPDPDWAFTTSMREPAPLPPGVPVTLQFSRRCGSCGGRWAPHVGYAAVIMNAASWAWNIGDPPADVSGSMEARSVHVCGHCSSPLPAPALWSRVERDEGVDAFRLSLTDDLAATHWPYVALSVEMARYPEAAAVAWQDLERHLQHERRPPCMVPGCEVKAVRQFQLELPATVYGRPLNPGDALELCPEHANAVLRGDSGDTVLVALRLRP